MIPVQYRTIMADPPWKYGDKLRMDPGVDRSSADNYNVMSTADICKLGDGDQICGHKVSRDALLALWTTGPFLLNGDAMKVANAWGFETKQLFTWVKGHLMGDAIVGALGMGHIYRVDTEHIVIATRGLLKDLPIMRHDLRNYIFLEPKTHHSRKPDEVAIQLETLSPGPYLELFAREQRDGWTCHGDEL